MDIASRALRNDTRGVLKRVQEGESVTITVDGIPVAVLQPVRARPQWMARRAFVADVLAHQADSGLTDELRSLLPDTTEDMAIEPRTR